MGIYLRQLLAGRDFGLQNSVAAAMSNFVYILGDDLKRECLIIDPAWDVKGILERIDEEGYQVSALPKHQGAFEQIKEAHTGDFNGVGLGLNIVKKYLELMNGDIRVESQPGEGSTFIFSLPHYIALSS